MIIHDCADCQGRSRLDAMRVVFFLQGQRVPAARFRGVAVAQALIAAGMECDLRVPVPSVYGDWLPGFPTGPWRQVLVPFVVLVRLAQLRDLRPSDVVFFQRPMIELPTVFLEKLAARGRKSVFDFDDAIFLNRGGRAKLRRTVALVDRVVAGNRLLAEATEAPEKTTIIPTAVDTDRWAVLPTRDVRGSQVVVGWTGLSCNYRHLALAATPIARALRRTGARFVAISDRPPPSQLADLRPEFVPWRVDSEVEDLARLDVGVMPLPDGPYERGKCAFKLIQYMALGRPGLASPVGANCEVVTDGSDGFLPRTEAVWEEQLVRLIEDPELRAQVGSRARQRVQAAYSIAAVAPRYLEILHSLAAG
jgi:glycosyltransferase involved in cell wall biosynthesis